MIKMEMQKIAIVDVHTHHDCEKAIISRLPEDFLPELGKYYSVGIHPWKLSFGETADLSKNNFDESLGKEIKLLEKSAAHPQVLAIGETGLDKLIKVDLGLQEKIFCLQIEVAEKVKKPLIIHSVKTSNEVIRLKKKIQPSVPWIIHGFRNNVNVASQLLKEGLYLSFGEKYSPEVLRFVPLERLFVETDESETDICRLYSRVAEILSIPLKELTVKVQQNIREVFFRQ